MIFGLRNVRRMLDKTAASMEPQRLAELKKKLARETDDTRGAEWEVAICYALSHFGSIVDFGTTHPGNPDFIWTPDQKAITVEITSISDKALDRHNAIDNFLSELRRMEIKHGINKFGGLYSEFGEVEKNTKITIGIPEAKDFIRFFEGEEIKAFFRAVVRDPQSEHIFTFTERGSTSNISYHPGQRYLSSNYRNYSQPVTLQHSSIVNSLGKKEHQLKKSAVEHPAILFICDNGCGALKPSIGMGSIGTREIVGAFLNGQPQQDTSGLIGHKYKSAQGRRIHAVVCIAVQQSRSTSLSSIITQLKTDIVFATYADPYLRTPDFTDLLHRALAFLPAPINTPINAGIRRTRHKYYKGLSMSGSNIKFSSLKLQELIAGDLSYEHFARDYPELVAYFKTLTKQGKMLNQIEIEDCENEDDDWVTFSFGKTIPDRLFDE